MADETLILPFADWKLSFDEENSMKTAKGMKGPKAARAYTPENEPPPDYAWYRMDKSRIDEELHDIVTEVTSRMEAVRAEDTELMSLLKSANEVKKVSMKDPKSIAIVGQQAMGKSLLINALFHRRNLSKTSAAGGACTASAIKYVHKSDAEDLAEIYDAAMQFMDDMNLNEVIEEHIRRYFHFHFSNKVDPVYHDEEERSALTALAFFSLLYNIQNDPEATETLERRLTAEEIEQGKLLRGSVRMALRRIEETGAGANRTKEFRDMTISDLMENISNFISQQEGLPSLWHIVQFVTIFMGSPLLRNGVSVVDLPGLGDLNHSRTAATNTIRRQADFEIIVAKSDRVTTEEVVDQQIKQSIRTHGAKNTILVLTKIDEFFLDHHSVENIIEQSSNAPFPTIKEYMAQAEDMWNDLDQFLTQNEDEDVDVEEASATIVALQAYQEYLNKAAQCAFIQQRALNLENKMKYKFKEYDEHPIRVFSVSSSMYVDWMKKRRNERPVLSPEQTGIPKLRKFLLGVPADDNLDCYRQHIGTKLPAFLDTISRIVDQEGKDDAYGVIRPKFMAIMKDFSEKHTSIFVDFMENKVQRLWALATSKRSREEGVIKVIRNWADNVRWNTYNKVLREKGIVKKTDAVRYRGRGINWNEEISQEIGPDILSWKHKMRLAVKAVATNLDNSIKAFGQEVVQFLSNSELAGPLKLIAIEEWNKRQEEVFRQSASLENILKDQISHVHKYATTETDTRCMLSVLNSTVYDQINKIPWEEGWYVKQKDALLKALVPANGQGDSIIDKIADHVDIEAKRQLDTAFWTFMNKLVSELELFDEHIGQRLPPEYEITEGDLKIRDSLKNILPELSRRISDLDTMIEAQGMKRDRDMDIDGEPETPTKRTRA